MPTVLRPEDIPVIVVAHNERRLLPAFLNYYRALGVTRFAVVDDSSTDGSPEYLAAQPDVDLWTSSVRYGEADRGRYWREHLFSHYGRNRWYLVVDVDEFLIFDGSDAGVFLADFIGCLERRGITRCAAPMIDAYPAGPIDNARIDLDAEQMPWQVATHVDATGYRLRRGKTALELTGGARHRLFDSSAEMMKYPLIRVDEIFGIGKSIHRPIASERNFDGIFGILLHFKIDSSTLERSKCAILDKQYYREAREYKKILDNEHIFRASALFEGSMKIGTSKEFIRHGFFLPLQTQS